MAEFDPQKHMTKMKRWDKEKNAHVYDDYLEVKWRIVWFRSEHWDWGIDTTPVILSENAAIVKAVITDETGRVIATGMATVRSDNNAKWSGRDFEKAETAAIGRALAHAGYGTQFTGEDEGDFLADSPVTPRVVQNGSQSTDEPMESEATNLIAVKFSEAKKRPYMVSEQCAFWSREPFKQLGFDTETWKDAVNKVVELPTKIKIKYVKNGDYREPVSITRLDTGETVEAQAG